MGDDMIPIYLCEDNPLQLDLLKSMIEKYIFIQAYDMEIRQAVHTPHELLDLLPDQPENAVYFLDIHLHSDMDGIELASAIHQKDPRAFIIFTTTHSEMAMTTFRYQVEPLGFLIKDDPNYTLQILHCLQSVLEKSKIPASPNGRLHFRMPDQDLFIPIHEILYIEATGAHRITVHTTTAIYQCSGSLNETLSKLDQSFFLCHKSCLVNTAHIRTLYRRPCQIVLDNGAVCPCAQRRFSQLQHLMGIE